MRFVVPTIITDAMLISSSVAEADYTAWNAATAYVAGDRVIRVATHKVYERLVPGTTATAPEGDPTNWEEVGSTNRWRMFDQSVGSVTEAADTITVTIAPGMVNSLALLDINAGTVQVTMTDGAGGPTVYDQTFYIGETSGAVGDWYEYFFTVPRRRTILIVNDLPFYVAGRITVTLSDPLARCGTLAAGLAVEVGRSQYGASVGITDYSRKTTNDYGVTSVTRRGFARRIDVPALVSNGELDYIVSRLAEVRATPCVWIASDRMDCLVAYGFYRDWGTVIKYADFSEIRISIEGLV